MEILYLLIPLAVILAGVIVWAFLWSIRSGQFDDLEGPAHRILMDEDDAPRRTPDNKPGRTKKPRRRR
jgi:cbb3-type cytochrome oxidase maturation protein